MKEDFSDLRQQYEWAEAHLEESYEIARRGQLVCLETIQADTAKQRLRDVIYALPPATYEHVQQANDLFDNHLEEFYHTQ